MLELKNISFSANEKVILKNINLTFEDDQFIVITGQNGGGKSTLAKIIAGIEKPDKGQIILNGVDITNFSITERAKAGVSFAFQQPVRFKGISVYDLLKLASNKDKLSKDEACKFLSRVGLCAEDYISRNVDGSLSGGELKRIEIATVMARGTAFSIFDEPEAGIDLWSFSNLIKVFERLRKQISNASILIISHQERILNIADKIVVITAGEVSAIGTKDEILPSILNGTQNISCKYMD